MLFCRSLTQSKGVEQKSEEKKTVFDNPADTEVLVKKEDRDEYYFMPTAKGKKGKSKAKASEEKSSKPIKHNAETFRLFSQLGLNAPITTDDIPDTMAKLEAKLEDYREKVREWEVTRDEKKRYIMEHGSLPKNEEEEEEKEEEAKEEGDKESEKDEEKEEEKHEEEEKEEDKEDDKEEEDQKDEEKEQEADDKEEEKDEEKEG